MATREDFVEHIVSKLAGAGMVTSRKMFGEYALYIDELLVALICDNQLFVKPTEPGRAFAPKAELAPPYPGAKDYMLIAERDYDNAPWLTKLIRVTIPALPPPKPKKKKASKKTTAKKKPVATKR